MLVFAVLLVVPHGSSLNSSPSWEAGGRPHGSLLSGGAGQNSSTQVQGGWGGGAVKFKWTAAALLYVHFTMGMFPLFR